MALGPWGQVQEGGDSFAVGPPETDDSGGNGDPGNQPPVAVIVIEGGKPKYL